MLNTIKILIFKWENRYRYDLSWFISITNINDLFIYKIIISIKYWIIFYCDLIKIMSVNYNNPSFLPTQSLLVPSNQYSVSPTMNSTSPL